MSNWYKIKKWEKKLPLTEFIIVEECDDGKVYERFIDAGNGKAWKVSGNRLFCMGENSEKFKNFQDRKQRFVKKITLEEAFTLML